MIQFFELQKGGQKVYELRSHSKVGQALTVVLCVATAVFLYATLTAGDNTMYLIFLILCIIGFLVSFYVNSFSTEIAPNSSTNKVRLTTHVFFLPFSKKELALDSLKGVVLEKKSIASSDDSSTAKEVSYLFLENGDGKHRVITGGDELKEVGARLASALKISFRNTVL